MLSSPVTAVMEAYAGKYKMWEFKRVPAGFWSRENGIEATRWLAEEKLKLSPPEIVSGMKKSAFEKYGLLGMLAQCFDGRITEARKAAYLNFLTNRTGRTALHIQTVCAV